ERVAPAERKAAVRQTQVKLRRIGPQCEMFSAALGQGNLPAGHSIEPTQSGFNTVFPRGKLQLWIRLDGARDLTSLIVLQADDPPRNVRGREIGRARELSREGKARKLKIQRAGHIIAGSQRHHLAHLDRK